MSTNTGFQQAIYAAKFTAKGEIPLDKDGNFCSISGNKQAIILLKGHNNPDPSKYEVVGYFKEGDVIDDYPSMIYNTEACPLPEPEAKLPEYNKEPIRKLNFSADPEYDITMTERKYILDRFASDDWDAKISEIPQEGGITSGTYPTRKIGEYEWMIDNFKLRYTPDGFLKQYALTQASLDKSDINNTVVDFIQTNGSPLYAGIDVDKYLPMVKCYNLPNNFDKDSSENLFSSRYITNYKVENKVLVKDPNYISWFLPPDYGNLGTKYLLSKDGPTSILQSHMVWGSEGNYTIQEDRAKYGEGTNNIFSGQIDTMPSGVLIVISSDGTKLEDLPRIKIEATTFDSEPTPWNEPKYNYYTPNWSTADKEDFLQLFGMVGEDLSVENLIKNLFVSPKDTELSWVDNWALSNQSEDIIGFRILPCGQRDSSFDSPIMGFGERMGFVTRRESGDSTGGTPPIYFNMQSSTNSVGKLVYDNVTNVPPEKSIKFWQRNQRFCRRLTDQELGYRLWRDDANDKIHVTSLTDAQPTNTIELEKGLLRGMAVRWMNEDKTKVLAPLSKLLGEIDKTKNGGGYGWYGFYD